MIDELSIVANGQTIRGWQEISVTRSIEQFPSSFDLALTEKYPTANEIVVITPGTRCDVMIGDTKVITGYIDMYASQISAETHDVHISGRSVCEDLIDCSAFFGKFGEGNTTLSDQTMTQLATMLCDPFNIKVINKQEDGPQISLIVINLGESAYEVIEKCARWLGLLVYDDPDGNLILDRVGTTSMASGFKQGVNVEAASINLRTDARFTDYYCVWQATNAQNDTLQAVGGDTANLHGYAEDKDLKALGRYRPHYIVSQLVDVDLGIDLGQRIADWENNRRWGRSQCVNLTTTGWRDKAGKLWTPNALCPVDIPIVKASDLNWVIGSVTYKRSLQGGTTSDLVLYPPKAFDIEPITLLPGDADLVTSIRQARADEAAARNDQDKTNNLPVPSL